MKTFKDHLLSAEDLSPELKEEIARVIDKERDDENSEEFTILGFENNSVQHSSNTDVK